MFKKLRVLWQGGGTGSYGVEAEPSEARLRTFVLLVATLIGPPLLLFAYWKLMFPGLINSDALDFAQLGRNMSSGRGFVTFILRPLGLTHGENLLAQPELMRGPLYPFVLALAFGALGARDWVAAMVSGAFYLLTIPVLYRLGTRAFNRAVGLAAALIFMFNALMLEYATSGLHITLYTFLATSLLLVLYNVSAWARDRAEDPSLRLPKGQFILAGLLTGLLFLTEPIYFWVLPVVLVAVVWLGWRDRFRAVGWFLVPLGILVLPWMARCWMVTGNPFFGLRGLELWMNTSVYPNTDAYRLMPEELVPGAALFKAVSKKLMLGFGQAIQAFPQVTASWVLAFFLPGLLFQFADPAANTVRRVMMGCFLAILAGTLLFSLEMPLFVALIPAMLVFSVAFLQHLTQQAQLTRGSMTLLTSVMAVAVVYPLLSDMFLSRKPEKQAIQAYRAAVRSMPKDEACFSNEPTLVAWYGDRPSILLPSNDHRIGDLKKRFSGARWLVLTPSVQYVSREWQYVYNRCTTLNRLAAQELQAGKKVPGTFPLRDKNDPNVPLLDTLKDFAWIRPSMEGSPDVVTAAVPPASAKVAQGTSRTSAEAP
jgi:4-amino-4-deoxy-L-arabinose transferase-like glycosyltransferase